MAASAAKTLRASESAERSALQARELEAIELEDVPAAVVCAQCGKADCPGCLPASEEATNASQVVAIVPWERPGISFSRRLWSTSTAATCNADRFFAALPDGDVGVALRFAVVSEVLAALGLAFPALGVVFLFFGDVLLFDPVISRLAVRLLLLGVPGLASAMIALHTLHGVGLDWAAKRQGSRAKSGRGLRFGLYSCGMDLVTLPLGLLALGVTQGFAAFVRGLPLGLSAPSRASAAYLRGFHKLDETQLRKATRMSTGVVGIPMLLVVLPLLAGLVVLAVYGG